jgi:catechol 2,3-dioxygenase-like lactoylglutathione lyase family enzyme
MLDHITIRVSDRAASEAFYDLVLGTIGHERSGSDEEYTVWRGQFSLARADDAHPVTRHLHMGFAASSRELVNTFWRSGIDAGSDDHDGASLLDPDGNSAEAVQHRDVGNRDVIDHLWIGVADVPAARAFYELAAPFTGFSPTSVQEDRVHFGGANASFALVDRTPTENLHIAFEATDDEAVDAFHDAMTRAGYADNGPPGERHYHRGYYGAFVLDPDGNNVEVVNHNRAR